MDRNGSNTLLSLGVDCDRFAVTDYLEELEVNSFTVKRI